MTMRMRAALVLLALAIIAVYGTAFIARANAAVINRTASYSAPAGVGGSSSTSVFYGSFDCLHLFDAGAGLCGLAQRRRR